MPLAAWMRGVVGCKLIIAPPQVKHRCRSHWIKVALKFASIDFSKCVGTETSFVVATACVLAGNWHLGSRVLLA